jgi:hypothetical protein
MRRRSSACASFHSGTVRLNWAAERAATALLT